MFNISSIRVFSWNGTQVIVAVMLACMFGLGIASAPASAQDRFGESRDQDRALRARSNGEVRPLENVIGGARTKGKVLDVELKDKRYKVKVLDNDGRVRTVDVDASPDRGSSNGSGDRSGPSERSGSSDHGGSSGSGSSGSSGRGGGSGRDGNEGSGGRGRGGGR